MKFALRNLAVILALLVLMLFAATVNAEQPVTEHRIPGSMGNVYGVLRMPAGDAPMPLIILSHGFGGSHVGAGITRHALFRKVLPLSVWISAAAV